jgi:hypothetical protein
MQVKEEGASSISPEEGIGEEVMTLHINELSPKEMPAGGDVVDTTDTTNAGKDMPSEVDEDVMHFVGDPASLSSAESVEDELGAPADDAPPEELPSGACQEIDALPPVADDNCIPYASAEREPLVQSPEARDKKVELQSWSWQIKIFRKLAELEFMV